MDFGQFSSLTAYGKDLMYFREKIDEIRKSVAMVRLGACCTEQYNREHK